MNEQSLYRADRTCRIEKEDLFKGEKLYFP